MPTDNRASGIDISAFQQNINWQQVRAAGISFAMARASYGISDDSTFAANWQGMKTEKILRGAYHYFLFSVDPLQQAQFFAKTIKLEAGDLPPILDVEVFWNNDYHYELDFLRNLSLAERARRVKVCLDSIENLTSHKPMIYTAPWFWDEYMSGGQGQPPIWSSQYELWTATWGVAPQLPRGWTQWRLWQYDAQGSVAGVASEVDRDYFNGTVAELRAWVGAPPEEEPPPPTPIPSLTHQMMINAFGKVFGAEFYWGKLAAAGLTYLTNDRQAAYQGPSVYDLPNLTDQEKNVLVAVLAGMGVDVSLWKKTPPVLTNQAMINTFEIVFGGSYWNKLEAAKLTAMANDRRAAYGGSNVYDLPNLSDQDKELIIASLKKQGFDVSMWQKPPATTSSLTNQGMINAFYQTFGADLYWSKVASAGLTSIAANTETRKAAYNGPNVYALPNLSRGDKDALAATLMKWGIDSSVWQSPSSPYTNLTNQQMINIFYNVFGEKYWSKLESSALGWLANNRGAVYSGATIENLPALTAEDKSALIIELNKSR